MMRRVTIALAFVLCVVPSAWPKFKEDEQSYLEDHFKAIQDQVQALTTQLQTLNAQLQQLLQNQAQFQAIVAHQQRSLQDLDQMVTSMRLGSEENYSNLKTAITQLRSETQAAFVKLSGGSVPSPTGGGGTIASGPASPSTPAQGYVLAVDGNNVTLDTGAVAGIHEGSRLVLYKSSDPNTRVGVLEVIQVMDGGKSRAQVVTLNPGVRPDFSDVVRLE
jgi:outer membrane murein-binding lipoprotein Lpp